ncbi:MAG: PEGA domain-containing protein [Polyangiaceae bacterium]
MSIALSIAVMLLMSVLARTARAEPPNQKAMPVYVLSVLTEDADDQADALTQALRMRVRQAPGLSLLETQQSLETLTIALRCPPHPDAPCLQRIGDQLHADHYLWGSLAKKRGGQVEVEAHFWSRGRPQLDATESYSDNLKDPGDEALKAVAAKLVSELTGAPAGGGASSGSGGGGNGKAPASGPGTLIVHAGSEGGTVTVDGVEKGTLEEGTARIELPEGSHTVTVHVPGFKAPSLTTSIKAGGEQEVSFALAPGSDSSGESSSPEAPSTSKSFPVHKVVGWTGVILGAAAAVFAVVEVAGWVSDKNDSDTQRASIPANVPDACSVPAPGAPGAPGYAAQAKAACNDSNDAKDKSTFSWVAGAGALVFGGVGAYFLLTDHDGDSTTARRAPAPATRVGVAPMVGPHEGGLRLRVDF